MSTTATQLKHQARDALLEYRRLTDGLDCGARVAQHINPRAAVLAREFDDAMTALRALDPLCPKSEPLFAGE